MVTKRGRHRAPAGAHPVEHGQPARERAPGAGAARGPAVATRASRSSSTGADRAERPNLVATPARARRRARRSACSPTSTPCCATPEEWQHDPWSGDLADGFVWGRGALDMKSQTAAEVAAAIRLAQSGWRPARGDLLVVAVVDEETGGARGRAVALREPPRPRALRLPAQRGRRRGHPVRRAPRLRRLRRREGRLPLHAHHRRRRRPRVDPEDRRQRAAQARAAAPGDGATASPRYDVTDGPRALLEGLGVGRRRGPDRRARAAQRDDPRLGAARRADARRHARADAGRTPRRRSTSSRRSAELEVDCRVPPGLGEETARRRIEEVLGDDGYRLEFSEQVVGNASPVESPLMDAIRDWVADAEPDAAVVPTILPGLHRLADVPRRVPRLRRLRLLPAAPPDRSTRPRRSSTPPTSASTCATSSGRRDFFDVRDQEDARMSDETDKLRLGGMALRNGLLVHGPTHWAAAVRATDGTIAPRVRAPSRASRRLDGVPACAASRGWPRRWRSSRSSSAHLPRGAAAVRAGARRRRRGAARRSAPALLRRAPRAARSAARRRPPRSRSCPSLVALRAGELAAYHGAEHKAIGEYEPGTRGPRPRSTTAAARHLMAPLLASNLAGRRAAQARRSRSPRRWPAARSRSRRSASRSRSSAGPSATPTPRRARALQASRATSCSACIGTREPTAEQLEVGRAALDEILRAEGAADGDA